MRKTTLFIAMSLDGYIADRNGKVDWLAGHGRSEEEELQNPDGDMSSYHEFVKEIDTVLMGYKTYSDIVSELSVEAWPYEGMQTYVFTHRPEEKPGGGKEIILTDEEPGTLVEELKGQTGSGIWICGGANLANQLIRGDLVDRFHISVIPVILGGGIRLFENFEKEKKLRLIAVKSYNGIVDLIYEKR